MVWVNIDQIKRNFLAYLQRVEAGETLVIVQSGKPMAEVRPFVPRPNTARPIGLCAGEFTVPDDFDDPLPENIRDEVSQ